MKASMAKAKTAKPADIAKDSASTDLEALAGSSEAIDRLLAKHPKAGAALLEKLSHSSDKATRKSVCLNPNSPKETLIRLAPQFPGDFFQNPAFDWLLLEDPNLLFDIGGGVLKNILKRPECPVSFLKWAASHGDEGQQLAAAMNPLTPVESLRELLKSMHSTVVASARGHAALAGEQAVTEVDPEAAFLAGIAEALANLSPGKATDLRDKGYLGKHHVPALAREVQFVVSGYYEVLFKVVSQHNFPIQVMERLAQAPAISGRCEEAVSNPNCPVSMLETLAQDKDPDVRSSVARNPNCPVPVLEKLAQDKDTNVRWNLTRNPNCPVPVLEMLAQDKDGVIRYRLAIHPNCPVPVLEKLAQDKDPNVRSSVASNPNCPTIVLEALAQDPIEYVRGEAASNPNCPLPVLKRLAHDKDPMVQNGVALNPNCPPPVLESLAWYEDGNRSYEVLESALSNPNCPVALLEILAKDGDSDIQYPVATHPNYPVHLRQTLLEKLAQDPDKSIRGQVATHPNCPIRVLEKLAQDKDRQVRCGVAGNPNCPAPVLEKLAQDKDRQVRCGVAGNPNCPAPVLEGLAQGMNRDVRRAVVGNPNTPQYLLETFAWGSERSESIDAAAKCDHLVHSFLAMDDRCQGWMDNRISFDFHDALCKDAREAKLLWPTEALAKKGVNHKLGIVRALALAQPDCPVEALAKNQKHVDCHVRAAIARNRNCPEVVLKALEKDAHWVVAAMAKRGLSLLYEYKNNANATKSKGDS